MVMYYYHRFNCQICGKRTRTRKSGVKGDFNGSYCHVCHRLFCYKCSVGGFCKDCIDKIPEDLGKPYAKKARVLKFLHYAYLGLIPLFFFLAFITFFLFVIFPNIGMFFIYVSSALLFYIFVPGFLIEYIVKLIEFRFSDKSAKILIYKFRQKENFSKNVFY